MLNRKTQLHGSSDEASGVPQSLPHHTTSIFSNMESIEFVQLGKPALSSNNCGALFEQLPYNANLVESNSHPSQLEDNQTQMKASIPKAPSGFGTTNSRSLRSRTNGRLQTSLKSSCDNLYSKVS